MVPPGVGTSTLAPRSASLTEFGYAVFGQVIEGTDVVHSIEKVRTGNKGGHQDAPVEAVVINSAKLELSDKGESNLLCGVATALYRIHYNLLAP